jgi:tRNA nucleotidyltransferase (CCA-adding enzyme)
MRSEAPPVSYVPRRVLKVVRALAARGYEAVIVGGAVRDLFLGRPVNDWDVASSARPEAFLEVFPRCHPTGLKHGTVTVVEEELPIEVTTYRGEGAYSDGRRPDEVRFGVPLAEDLGRRDFTINALAWDPLSGRIFDPYGGLSDLARRRVRAVGDPRRRFAEDGLRPMRAIRIAAVLGFEVDPETLAAIPETLPTFRKVAIERIREEFLKTLGASRPSAGLEALRMTGLLSEFLPEHEALVGGGQSRGDWERALRVVDCTIGPPLWRLAALLHDIAKPEAKRGEERHEQAGAPIAEEIGRRLKLSSDEVATLSALVAQHMFHYDPGMNDAAVRRLIRRVTPELLPALVALRRGDVLGRGGEISRGLAELSAFEARVARILEAKAPLAAKDLAVNGGDVMAAGVPRGPKVGEALRYLLEKVIEEPSLNTREALLALLPEALK